MATHTKGTIIKRHGANEPKQKHGSWWWRRYDKGEKSIRLGRCDEMSKHQARNKIAQLKLELNPHSTGAGTLLTVRQFVERFYDPLHIAVKMKPASALSARSLINKHILPVVGHVQLCDFDALVQQRLIAHMAAEQLSRKTIENAWAIVSSMGAFARRKKLGAPRVDREMVDFPPADLETPQRWFTPAEAARIIEASAYPWRACWALLWHTGMRGGEALGLQWMNVDFHQRVIRVRQNAVNGRIQTLKSKNSRSDLPMSAALERELRAYEQWFDAQLDKEHSDKLPASLLFCDEEGRPHHGRVARRELAAMLKALGLSHGGLHAFRHGVATQLFRSGASAPTVRAGLRHSDIKTTLRYSHTVGDDLRNAFEGLELPDANRDKPGTLGGNSTGNS